MAYEPLIVYLGNINTRQKVSSGSLEYYYFDIYPPLEIPKYPSGSSEIGLDIFGPEGADSVLVFFEPNHEDIFFRNHYEVLENNDETSRRSKILLSVDNNTSQLRYSNNEVISDSLQLNRKAEINRELFGQVQDSNYESKSWTIPRYQGSKLGSSGGVPSVLYLVNFQGILFDKNTTTEEIRDLFSRLPQQSIYFYTPATLETNGLFYSTDFSSIVVNESIVYTFTGPNLISTLYDIKILDINNGTLYSTNGEGVVESKTTIVLPTPTPTPTSTTTPTPTPTPSPNPL